MSAASFEFLMVALAVLAGILLPLCLWEEIQVWRDLNRRRDDAKKRRDDSASAETEKP